MLANPKDKKNSRGTSDMKYIMTSLLQYILLNKPVSHLFIMGQQPSFPHTLTVKFKGYLKWAIGCQLKTSRSEVFLHLESTNSIYQRVHVWLAYLGTQKSNLIIQSKATSRLELPIATIAFRQTYIKVPKLKSLEIRLKDYFSVSQRKCEQGLIQAELV